MVRGEKETLAHQKFKKNITEEQQREAESIHAVPQTSLLSGTQFKNDVVIKTKATIKSNTNPF